MSTPTSADSDKGKAAYERGDYATALKEWRPLAEEGDARAQTSLGFMYFKGHGVSQDYGEAVKWIRRAAEQGDAAAQFRLGFMYYDGQGVPQDYVEAMRWYRKAAEQGDVFGQRLLGAMYHDGLGATQDYVEAVKWYRKAAEQGYATAQLNLAGMYFRGRGVSQDYGEAVKWVKKAAEQGDPEAQHELGLIYLRDHAVPQDYGEAAKWIRKAAEQGFADAQHELAGMYIAYTEAEVDMLRELMDNRIYPIDNGLDLPAEGWAHAGSLLRTGKLARADSQYIWDIEALKFDREQLNLKGKDLIAELIHGVSQNAQQQELPNPDIVFALAVQELDQDIWAAEEGLRETRLKREKFGDEIPAEVRYQEIKRSYRAMNVRFAIIAAALSIIAIAIGAWLLSILVWLVLLPIALWLFVMFLVFLQWGFAGESFLVSLDSELREFAHRDRWIILPSRSDGKTDTDD